MNVYAATDDTGTVHLIQSPSNRDRFAAAATARLHDLNDGPGSPQELDLIEFPDDLAAGAWLAGDPFNQATVKPYGRIVYVYPGRLHYLAAGEPHPDRGRRGPYPVTEDDLDAYPLGDPKRIALQAAIDRGGF